MYISTDMIERTNPFVRLARWIESLTGTKRRAVEEAADLLERGQTVEGIVTLMYVGPEFAAEWLSYVGPVWDFDKAIRQN